MAPLMRRRRGAGPRKQRPPLVTRAHGRGRGGFDGGGAGGARQVAAAVAAAPVKGPWIAQGRDPAWRAQKLVEAMTLDEKIAMVHGVGLPLAGAGAG